MQKIDRVDFAQLLRELAAAGMSPVDVAAELTLMLGERVAPSTPYRWLDGSTPLHPHGDALLVLHGRRIRHSEISAAQHPARTGTTTQGDEDVPQTQAPSPRRRCAAG